MLNYIRQMLHPNNLSQKLLLILSIALLSALLGMGLLFLIYNITSDAPIQITHLEQILLQENSSLLKPFLAINHLTTFVVPALLYHKYVANKDNGRYIEYKTSIDWQFILKAIAFVLCCYPIAGLVTVVIEQLDLPSTLSNLTEDNANILSKLIKSNNAIDLMSSIVVVALIPSIGEELLFRGILQKIFSEHMKLGWAIGLTSFLFAALHFDPIGLGFKFIMGSALGMIYYYSRNIIIPIIIHFLNNALPILYFYFYSMASQNGEENKLSEILILGMIFIPLGYITFDNLRKHKNHG